MLRTIVILNFFHSYRPFFYNHHVAAYKPLYLAPTEEPTLSPTDASDLVNSFVNAVLLPLETLIKDEGLITVPAELDEEGIKSIVTEVNTKLNPGLEDMNSEDFTSKNAAIIVKDYVDAEAEEGDVDINRDTNITNITNAVIHKWFSEEETDVSDAPTFYPTKYQTKSQLSPTITNVNEIIDASLLTQTPTPIQSTKLYENASSVTNVEQEQEQTSSATDATDAMYERARTIATRVTACMSMLGSLLITIVVLSSKEKRRNVYHRLLLAMSLIDIHSSFWFSLSSFPFKGGVVTNQPLCNAQGWGTQMSIATPIYNTALAAFYLLVIRYRWKDDKLKKAELVFHAIPLSFAIITSLAGLALKLYNNATLWCWISPTAQIYRIAFFYGPLFLTILVSILLTASTLQYVVSTEQKSKKYSCNTNRRWSYSSRVAIQSFFYVAAYFVTWTPLVTARIIEFSRGTTPKWVLLLAAVFTPCQGFLNCCVYFRPRIIKYLSDHYLLSRRPTERCSTLGT